MRTRNGLCYPKREDAAHISCRHRRRKRPREEDATTARKRRRRAAGVDMFEALPDDLAVAMLCKLGAGSTSPAHFVSALLTCKRFNELGMRRMILSKASAKTVAVRAKNWSEPAQRFLKRCADAGNLEACYILGMITEEQLAALLINCGQVIDYRVCGDPNSILRFAFIKFTDDEGARAALNLSRTVLGYYPVRVLPSKTAITPVNPIFLPRSDDEREMCARTVYCTNIDKKVSQAEVKLLFESICGESIQVLISHQNLQLADLSSPW